MSETDHRPTVTQQASFTEDGEVETSDDPVETSLDQWGADIDTHDPETRIEQPQASLMSDTRPSESDTEPGEQEELFHATTEGQMDLTGDAADRFQFLFGDD